jgi:Fe-S-cluster containining protein
MINLLDSDDDYLKEKKSLGNSTFSFDCHNAVKCFTHCCRNINITLHPYDVLRMKRNLGMSSGSFLDTYTVTFIKDNPSFPSLMLKLSDDAEKRCSFLSEQGCSIYQDRPDTCRTYPIERAVLIKPLSGIPPQEYYFLTTQPICKGHFQKRTWTVTTWIQNQEIEPFNRMNDAWSEMDILFRSSNPWGPEGFEDRRFQMAFMACYNIDMFKQFVFESTFLKRYRIRPDIIDQIMVSDQELLLLGFEWIKFFLFGIRSSKVTLRS